RRRFAPGAELLEDRLAPAILLVTNPADVGQGTLGATIFNSVNHVNGGTGNDTIQFAPALAGQTLSLTSFDSQPTPAGPSAFPIEKSCTLVIDGATGLTQGITINGSDALRLFSVDATSSLTLMGLTLTGGQAAGAAGGNALLGGAGGASAGL